MAKNKNIYGKFFDPIPYFAYNKAFMIFLGLRSIGKSTGIWIYLILRFIRHGEKLYYIRRREDEIKMGAGKAFSNAIAIINRYYKKNYKMTCKKIDGVYNYYLDGKHMGYAGDLYHEERLKSVNLSDVCYILYDEFIPKRARDYIGGRLNPFEEYDIVYSLYKSCNRDVDEAISDRVKVILIGNTTTYFNPFILTFGAEKRLTPETKVLTGDIWLIQQSHAEDIVAMEGYEETTDYKLAAYRQKLIDYNFGTGFHDKEFIGKPSGKLIPIANMFYQGYKMGISYSDESGIVYVQKGTVNSPVNLAMSGADHKFNMLLALKANDRNELRLLKSAYDNGLILFETEKIRFLVNSYLMFDMS